ncbi:RNA polymerase sigma factor [Paraflavitalea speifideaquila]|uniref:RNA polymerase sigma factor n=1 Tax=Paraflavitalea speifideaquila TaxID=3076558 RepID=UPI0028E1AD08|nr:sigma factor [Paraflavitalea speifideiaquila]
MSDYCLHHIIAGIRNRDRALFSDLFDRYSHTMYLIALDILKDHELARDTVQEAFLKLWEKSDTIHIQTSIKSYLFRTSANLAINKYKKESRIVHQNELHVIIEPKAPTENRAEEKNLNNTSTMPSTPCPPSAEGFLHSAALAT